MKSSELLELLNKSERAGMERAITIIESYSGDWPDKPAQDAQFLVDQIRKDMNDPKANQKKAQEAPHRENAHPSQGQYQRDAGRGGEIQDRQRIPDDVL